MSRKLLRRFRSFVTRRSSLVGDCSRESSIVLGPYPRSAIRRPSITIIEVLPANQEEDSESNDVKGDDEDDKTSTPNESNPNTDQSAETNPTFIQAYFKLANYMGLVPYQYSMKNEEKVYAYQIPFILMALLVAIHTFSMLKITLLSYLKISESTQVGLYIILWRNVAQVMTRIALIFTLFRRSSHLSSFMNQVDGSSHRDKAHSTQKFYAAIALMTLSLVSVLIEVFTSKPVAIGYDVSAILEFQSRYVISTFTTTSLEGEYEIMDAEYTGEVTVSVVLLGLLGYAIKVEALLMDNVARDILLLLTLSLRESVNNFRFDNIPPAIHVSALAFPGLVRTQIISEYNELSRISRALNDTIKILLKLLLLQYLLFSADFLENAQSPQLSLLYKSTLSLTMLKVVMTLWWATGIASRMDEFKEWFFLELKEHRLGVNPDDAQLILDEITMAPIGIGTDIFYINQAFMANYAIMVVTYFFSTVETRVKAGTDCNCYCN